MDERVRHFVFNRDGVTEIDADGAGFAVDLNNSIAVPKTAINCTVECTNATVWNISPNIGASLNNNLLRVSGVFPTTSGNTIVSNPFNFTMVFTEGIYNIETFNTEVQRQWTQLIYNALGVQHTDDWFDFLPNESSGKVYIQPTRAFAATLIDEVIFHFADPGSCHAILGFDPVNVNLPRTGYVEGTGIAKFNNVDGFLILCPELAARGIPINGAGVSCIARIPIFEASAGEIIQYAPYIPFRMSGQHLVGQEITRVTFQLRNQLLRPIIMREDWSVVIAIKFLVLLE